MDEIESAKNTERPVETVQVIPVQIVSWKPPDAIANPASYGVDDGNKYRA